MGLTNPILGLYKAGVNHTFNPVATEKIGPIQLFQTESAEICDGKLAHFQSHAMIYMTVGATSRQTLLDF